MKQLKTIILVVCIFFMSCVKKVGTNPEVAYSDRALFDSTKNQSYYYKNKDTLLSGAHGPHGTFKLRFNSIAAKALTNNGKLPVNGVFPEGSFVVKDVYKNGSIDIYAYMYKRNGNWLWGEVHSNGSFQYYAKDGASVCVGCHSQSGNRDFVVAFNFY